jgi:predicted Zn-ribbon and HTH transcriptional regulator
MALGACRYRSFALVDATVEIVSIVAQSDTLPGLRFSKPGERSVVGLKAFGNVGWAEAIRDEIRTLAEEANTGDQRSIASAFPPLRVCRDCGSEFTPIMSRIACPDCGGKLEDG